MEGRRGEPPQERGRITRFPSFGGGYSFSSLPLFFVVVAAPVPSSSFSCVVVSLALLCDGGGFAFPPLQKLRELHHKAVRREAEAVHEKLKNRATKKKVLSLSCGGASLLHTKKTKNTTTEKSERKKRTTAKKRERNHGKNREWEGQPKTERGEGNSAKKREREKQRTTTKKRRERNPQKRTEGTAINERVREETRHKTMREERERERERVSTT